MHPFAFRGSHSLRSFRTAHVPNRARSEPRSLRTALAPNRAPVVRRCALTFSGYYVVEDHSPGDRRTIVVRRRPRTLENCGSLESTRSLWRDGHHSQPEPKLCVQIHAIVHFFVKIVRKYPSDEYECKLLTVQSATI
ncbi:hypothetical protein CV102_06225 [Natronococcus pandeyae]|uniref:Uncharacterized protein n=1 Tax=Natronococcus pandeyae TaxID=2055836 RepID=A0A8J8Q5U2_9EURY|nr:hypothetical protein CV102_06225 [Natronococcus pandeyae]